VIEIKPILLISSENIHMTENCQPVLNPFTMTKHMKRDVLKKVYIAAYLE